MKGSIKIYQDACKGCGLCIEACPLGLLKLSDKINAFGYKAIMQEDPEGKCTGCAMCALICPDIAIEVYREEKAEKKED